MKITSYVMTLAIFALAVAVSHGQNSGSLPQEGTGATAEFQEAGTEPDNVQHVPVSKMPAAVVTIDPEFWYPNRFNISDALLDARTHYRKGELRAAQAEVEEAVVWLKFIEANAVGTSKAEIQTVMVDLKQVASEISGEKSVSSRRLNTAFANVNLAIANHHFSRANELMDQSNLVSASRRLIAAADHLKNAASAADISPSAIVGALRDEYSPYGMVDQNFEVTPEQLKGDLDELSEALRQLSKQMFEKVQK